MTLNKETEPNWIKSTGLFSIFRSILITLESRWSPFVSRCLCFSVSLPSHLGLFQAYQLQLVSLSPSCSIIFLVFRQDLSHHHHHHHVMLVVWISLTLSRHFSLSFIASGRSSGQHPVSSHSCWMYVRAGRPAFARPYVGVHESTSLMSSFLLLQQCPACLVHWTGIVFVIGGRWPYSWCLVGCCCQDLFKIARSILV